VSAQSEIKKNQDTWPTQGKAHHHAAFCREKIRHDPTLSPVSVNSDALRLKIRD